MTGGRILIRDALLVAGTPGPARPFTGWLLVQGNRIAALGPGDPPGERVDRVIDGRERALIAGLVNAHAHSHSSLTRGSAEGAAGDQESSPGSRRSRPTWRPWPPIARRSSRAPR